MFYTKKKWNERKAKKKNVVYAIKKNTKSKYKSKLQNIKSMSLINKSLSVRQIIKDEEQVGSSKTY